MTYFMKMTENMYNNPKKYYDVMIKASGSRAYLSEFIRILREYYNSSRYGDDTGIFVYDDDNSVCFGQYSIHKEERGYREVKLLSTTKIGGTIL